MSEYGSPDHDGPFLMLVADGFSKGKRQSRVVEALKTRLVDLVQLRDHDVSDSKFEREASRLIDWMSAAELGTMPLVNKTMHIAANLGTGLHTGRRRDLVNVAKQLVGEKPVGYSAHSVLDAEQAVEKGADYIIFSPVFETSSKEGATPAGLDRLRECVQAVSPTPVFALGGITPDRVQACVDAGAAGVAVLSGIMESSSSAAAVARYHDALHPESPSQRNH